MRALYIEGRRWRHKVRGTTYLDIGRGRMQLSKQLLMAIGLNARAAEKVSKLAESADMVIYQSEADDSLWVRPAIEFMDGRFEELL